MLKLDCVELGYTECQGCNLSLHVGSYYILNISLPTISQRSQLMESAWVAALLKISQERAMRRSGCRASEAHDHAQTPLDTTTIPIQRPEFGSSNGEPSPLARGMDYDKIGDIHKWRRMDTTYMSSTQGKRTDWCRIMELSNSMDPTQKAGNQLKEVKGAAGNRNADELVLVGYYTGAPAGITAELLLRPRAL